MRRERQSYSSRAASKSFRPHPAELLPAVSRESLIFRLFSKNHSTTRFSRLSAHRLLCRFGDFPRLKIPDSRIVPL